MEDEKTTILIRKSTRDELKKLGQKGDEYDEIIRRLIDYWKVQPFVPADRLVEE